MKFKLVSNYSPTGDQPQAIKALSQGLEQKQRFQTLLGVTGSGKTYTVANVIQKLQKPTLVISHNKTLAAQLYQEFRDYFPQNGVSYFVSYYDYYQPEAYIPQTDTYIEKETEVNEEIDKLRLLATTNLLTRKDVIVVASVSSIYNIGSPLEYGRYIASLKVGEQKSMKSIMLRFIELQYSRNDMEFFRGTFRLRGDVIEIWPAYLDYGIRIELVDEIIKKITSFEPASGNKLTTEKLDNIVVIYPAKHYMTDPNTRDESISQIRKDLAKQVKFLKKNGQDLEAHRINQRVEFDLEMVQEFGYVNGIENYSRYFDGRGPGDPPNTLLDYFKHCSKDFLVIIDESHMTIPQIRGMYNGDHSRKKTLIDFGFRLPSALDNRPLKFEEFLDRVPQAIFTSATPNVWERSMSESIVEQLIRPTGLIDPEIEIRKSDGQIDDLISEIEKRVAKTERVLITTLTKRTAEVLSDYLKERGIKVNYLHSDIHTLDRSDILDSLRLGDFDVIVGINLLREGLDLPEVSLVAILDADKEGFLRSETSLVQTMGRAARHINGRVVMYADRVTNSMQLAIDEVKRRRQVQLDYNQKHNITPTSITKPIRNKLINRIKEEEVTDQTIMLSKKTRFDFDTFDPSSLTPYDKKKLIPKLNRRMNQAAKELDFELAAKIRDTLSVLQ